MSLPKLPDFNDDFEVEEKVIKKDKIISVKLETEDEVEQPKRGRPRIPKSKYDENGKPVLAVPDLDDVNLTDEIEKYFGREDE